jgi:hypothetical protein
MPQIVSRLLLLFLRTGTEQEQSTTPVGSVQAFAHPHKVPGVEGASDAAQPPQPSGHRPMTPGERTLRARAAAYEMHAKHGSQKAALRGQAALLAKFERQIDPDGLLTPEERRRRAMHARRAHMARLALASARSRRAK